MMFSPCDPCCGSCQITVGVFDLCNQGVSGAYVTITQKGQTKILDSGYTVNGQIILKPNGFGFFTVKSTYPGLQDSSTDVFACDTCNCLVPAELDIVASVNFARQGNYFNNVPSNPTEPIYYPIIYQLRPTLIPKKLTIAVYDPKTNTDSTITSSTINLPDNGWYSTAIPGTRNGVATNFYFYLWFVKCQAKVMMIDISTDSMHPYAAGATSTVVTYNISQCASPCICPYVPKVLNLTSSNTNIQGNATLTYQTIPSNISQWLGQNINQTPVPQFGWFSDQIVPPQNVPGNILQPSYIIPSYRYYFFCNTLINAKYALFGLPLNGQLIPLAVNGPISFNFTVTHDTYTGHGQPIFPTLSCNPFLITGLHSNIGQSTALYGTGDLIPLTISGIIDGDAIRIPDFVLTTIKNSITYSIFGNHTSDDLELNKSGNGGNYS